MEFVYDNNLSSTSLSRADHDLIDLPTNPDGASQDLAAENAVLRSENEALRQQVADLSAYMRLAFRDALTGLPNRRYFDERIVEEIARATRQPDQFFSLLVIDVNDFKRINDTFGHATGDETLKWVATFLEGNLRLGDVCCRMAGDEFIVILPNTDRERAERLVARLRRLLEAAHHWLEIPVGLSIGWATFGTDGNTVETLFNVADEGMYQDKQRQRQAPSTKTPTDQAWPKARHGRLELVRPTTVHPPTDRSQSS